MIIAYFELIITVIHAVLLSLLYSAILLLLILIVAKISKTAFLSGIKNHKMKLWKSAAFVLFIFLMCYRFSYGRDNGLGETLQVPIGYEQHVYCADDQFVYFYPADDSYSDTFNIGKYAVKGNVLCAEVKHESYDNPEYDYVVFNLETRKNLPFKAITEYSGYAQANDLPMPNEFKDFVYYYRKFSARSQWEKWLLT